MDLIGTELPITQDYLAAMIGVRRTSVTGVAAQLQADGLISYRRGRVHIESIEGVQQSSCECHQAVKRNYKRLFGNLDGRD